jgi:hypothetical protein
MSDPWFYYLHTNGELIAKRFRPDPSDFVRKVWVLNLDERESAYVLLVEAAALGANMSRVLELAKHWHCDGADGLVFCERMGFICQPHESEAGKGYLLWHKDDDAERSRGEGSSPLLALISYTRQGDFGKAAA